MKYSKHVPPARLSGTERPQIVVALVGQPNCGKSTIFNQVVGYRSETANFPGSTVAVSRGKVRQSGVLLELIDVPGIYSLTTSNHAEASAKRFLLSSEVDLIINVVDSSLLSRGLELTLELLELGIPMLVCLNMMDDAERKAISISAEKLSEELKLPVVKTVGSRGLGIRELFASLGTHAVQSAPCPPAWSRDVERAIGKVESAVNRTMQPAVIPTRLVAVKLLEGDADVIGLVAPEVRMVAEDTRRWLESGRGRTSETIIMAERHDGAMRMFEKVAAVGRSAFDARWLIDDLLTHPLWGYVFLIAIFLGFFWVVFGIGSLLERALHPFFAGGSTLISDWLGRGTLTEVLLRGSWDGFAGGATIVLPYLVPFLFGLAFLEDIGYLPRVAYLLDGLLHRIGLHGTSVLPLMLGYGCSVPACMATRILPSKRDRFIASVLATLVPCSARSNVIVALVAFYVGPAWALGIFGFNLVVVVFSGWILTRLWPEVSPGMVLEVPRYQLPRFKVMSRKVWFRLREFVVLSWPLLIAGSVVLALTGYWHWDRTINAAFSPLTGLLGLPLAVGTTLVFGLLRKEMSIIMLVQALGNSNVSQVMSAGQIVVFTIFVMFYVPCIATIAALVKEIGRKLTIVAIVYSLLVATALGTATRLLFAMLQAS